MSDGADGSSFPGLLGDGDIDAVHEFVLNQTRSPWKF